MTKEVIAKTFLKALEVFHRDKRKAQKYFNDKRLTRSEKKILKAWYHTSRNNYENVFQQLNKITAHYSDLVEGQKNLILGIAYNNSGQFPKAKKHLEQAQIALKDYHLESQDYVVYNNLFVVFVNLGDKEKASLYLNKMKSLESLKEKCKISLLQNELTYYTTLEENLTKSFLIFDELEELVDEMSSIRKVNHFIMMFMLNIKIENFNFCYKAIERLKKVRSFKNRCNVIYMQKLLDYYLTNTPLYVYQSEFKNDLFLFHQLSTINALVEQDLDSLKTHWNFLMQSNPKVYYPDFSYVGSKNIFSLCFDKNAQKLKNMLNTPQQIEHHDEHSIEELTLNLLKTSTVPIHKEYLHKKIWGKEMVDKSDMDKVKNVISRLRKKYNVEIKYSKGCYQLVNNIIINKNNKKIAS